MLEQVSKYDGSSLAAMTLATGYTSDAGLLNGQADRT
jgi:hypothetical protein